MMPHRMINLFSMADAKPCDRCQVQSTLRYRIQHDTTDHWVLVCRACWEKLSQDNPHYRYGGTWKAKIRD
jgi:hypothetical protein